MEPQPVTLALGAEGTTSGLWLAPPKARATLVLTHGAGAGMAHKGMEALAQGLAKRGVATLRFNFLYMDRRQKRPDPPALAHRAVRVATQCAHELAPALPLFAGGRSFGARMTSQAQAKAALLHVRGLVFFAFPLHPAGKPSEERALHLQEVALPMIFVQGDHDALAEKPLLQSVVANLGERTELHLLAHADHSFHAPARSGRKDSDVLDEALDAAAAWMLARA